MRQNYPLKVHYFIVIFILLIISCKKEPKISLPALTTAPVTNITSTTAISGGSISSDGGAPITQRGICWNNASNPTISLATKTNDGTGIGGFSSTLTGLTGGSTYYVRSYGTNKAGTAYGNEIVFTMPFTLGQSFGGGIIFYIDGTGQHGLIAALNDISTGIIWHNGNYVTTNATSLTDGFTNTNLIITAQGNTAAYAAKLCKDYNGGGFNDWFLPSKDQLNRLYLQKALVGNFANNSYWSSTELDNLNAWYQYFVDGWQNYVFKLGTNYVRPIRAF